MESVEPVIPVAGMAVEEAFVARIRAWAAANGRSFPWRETSDPYRVLIGEMLLQRTRGEHVVDVYDSFLLRWPTHEHFARARESTIAHVVYPLGLSKRAPILYKLGRALGARGGVPTVPETLIQLP